MQTRAIGMISEKYKAIPKTLTFELESQSDY
jgi:hypothetical protein